MTIPEKLADELIYLDSDFISMLHEEDTGESPTLQISNDKGGEAKVSAGFVGLGGSTKVTRSYKKSSLQMLRAIQETLAVYPRFDASSFDSSRRTRTFWMHGTLTIGEWRPVEPATGPISQTFELIIDERRVTLVVQKDMFRSGFGNLADMESVLSLNMDIPVTALCRVLFVNPAAKCHIACPYIIFGRDDR